MVGRHEKRRRCSDRERVEECDLLTPARDPTEERAAQVRRPDGLRQLEVRVALFDPPRCLDGADEQQVAVEPVQHVHGDCWCEEQDAGGMLDKALAGVAVRSERGRCAQEQEEE